MKKITLSVLGICFGMLLVGCGTTTPADPAITNPEVNPEQVEEPTDTADSGETDTTVLANEGEVAVDTAYTTKLANCMSENDLTMYGTERCGHCKDQKELFSDAFANVQYIDCDADRQACLDAGVRGFPTWVDADGNAYPGTQSLERLQAIAGCEEL